MEKTVKEALTNFFQHDEFARLNGIEIVEIAEGYARTQVRIEPRHLNAGGYVQGAYSLHWQTWPLPQPLIVMALLPSHPLPI